MGGTCARATEIVRSCLGAKSYEWRQHLAVGRRVVEARCSSASMAGERFRRRSAPCLNERPCRLGAALSATPRGRVNAPAPCILRARVLAESRARERHSTGPRSHFVCSVSPAARLGTARRTRLSLFTASLSTGRVGGVGWAEFTDVRSARIGEREGAGRALCVARTRVRRDVGAGCRVAGRGAKGRASCLAVRMHCALGRRSSMPPERLWSGLSCPAPWRLVPWSPQAGQSGVSLDHGAPDGDR